MRRLAVAPLLVAMASATAFGGDVAGSAAGPATPGAANAPEVRAFVPIDLYEHERLHYFGRRDHHLLPSTVTVDRPPYVCDLDQRRFDERDAFLVHLRVVHHARTADIPDELVVLDGQVHFIGEK